MESQGLKGPDYTGYMVALKGRSPPASEVKGVSESVVQSGKGLEMNIIGEEWESLKSKIKS